MAEIVLDWSSHLLVLHDILLDISNKDGGKDSGREEDSLSRCHGAVRRDVWRAHRQESDLAEEPGEEKTRHGNKVVQTHWTEGCTRTCDRSGFFPWVRKYVAEVSLATSYR